MLPVLKEIFKIFITVVICLCIFFSYERRDALKYSAFAKSYVTTRDGIAAMAENFADGKFRIEDVRSVLREIDELLNGETGCLSLPKKELRKECEQIVLIWQKILKDYLIHQDAEFTWQEILDHAEIQYTFQENIIAEYTRLKKD